MVEVIIRHSHCGRPNPARDGQPQMKGVRRRRSIGFQERNDRKRNNKNIRHATPFRLVPSEERRCNVQEKEEERQQLSAEIQTRGDVAISERWEQRLIS